jgi:predicted ATPase
MRFSHSEVWFFEADMAAAEFDLLTLGPFEISVATRRAAASGQALDLPEEDVALLVEFVRHLGTVLARRSLQVLPAPAVALDARIARLNLALAPHGQGRYYIIEVDAGYMLITPERDGVSSPAPLRHNLPQRPNPIIGRERALREVGEQLRSSRLLNIVGGGGVGKTTLALAAVDHEVDRWRDGVRLLELAATTEPLRVAPALAALLDVRLPEGEPLQTLVEALAPLELLLVLDNCEQVVEEAARVVQALLQGTHGIRFLVTSREPLEVAGERVYRLAPLELPPPSVGQSWPQAMGYSAVQLFVEQARRADPGFRPEAVDPAALAELCRRLDGLPLAIELVAAWVDFYGVEGLLSELDADLIRLTNLSAPAQSSHRSLESLVDWSHAQLSEAEQTTFRRISVFRRGFGFESAFAVAVDAGFDRATVLNHLVRLAANSLLTIEVAAGQPMYRLPECHRAYASQRLAGDPQYDEIRRRHALHTARVFDNAGTDREALSRTAFLAAYGPLALDVAAAIDWAFSARGDPSLGIELTASSLHLGLDLQLVNEYRALVEKVLTEPRTRNMISPALEMQFGLALGGTIALVEGPGPAMDAAVRKLRVLSERSDSSEMHWKSLYGLWVGAFSQGQYRDADALARQLQHEADSEWTRREARRMLAQSRHHLGDHVEARRLAEALLGENVASMSPVLGGIEHKVSMRIVLARIEWIEGRPDAARRLAAEAVTLATHGVSQGLCQALHMAAFPIAWWIGDRAEALQHARHLRSFAGRHALGYYVEWATVFDAVMHTADPPAAAASLPMISPPRLDPKQRDMWWSLVGVQPEDVAAARERAASGETGWNVPDLLRACAMASASTAQAIPDLEAALAAARSQGAAAWELRCAVSLSPLWVTRGSPQQAAHLLRPLLARYASWPSLPDVQRARAILESIDAIDAGAGSAA